MVTLVEVNGLFFLTKRCTVSPPFFKRATAVLRNGIRNFILSPNVGGSEYTCVLDGSEFTCIY